MYSFDMRMPLSRIKTASSSVFETDLQKVKRRVQLKQEQMSNAHDIKHRAGVTSLSSGDFVRVKLPIKENKLAPTFPEPREVLRTNGRTVWLTNGQRWNMRHCISHSKGENNTDDMADYPVPAYTADNAAMMNQPAGITIRRSNRPRKAKDFGPDFVQ